MKFNYLEASKKNILIVAHRGVSAGNIPCNTLPAFETALKQGADVLEMDVDMCGDGELFIFHPGKERCHLYTAERLKHLNADEVGKLRYINAGDDNPTQFGLLKLDEFFETFKNRCFINVDKFWGHPVEIYNAIKRHNVEDQVIVKSEPNKKVFDVLEDLAPSLQFMPIISDEKQLDLLEGRNINYVGAEVLFTEEDSYLASPEFIEKMHRDDKLVWVNAIIYNYRSQLAAGHSDDSALTVSFDHGWGWLADRGFDFIQTDWPLMLIDYLKKENKYYR